MRLFVHVLEATDLPVKDSYVKVNVGKFKSKTWVAKGSPKPAWNEEFVFRAHDLDDEVVVSVFGASGVLVGRVRIPVRSIFDEDNQTLPPTWFSLERHKTAGKFLNKDTGKILLTISLHGELYSDQQSLYQNDAKSSQTDVTESTKSSSHKIHTGKPKHLVKSITKGFERIFSKRSNDTRSSDDSSELPGSPPEYEECGGEYPPSCSFEEGIQKMRSQNSGGDMPENLGGGVLIDQLFMVRPSNLNNHIFAPNSEFRTDLAKIQGTTDVVEGSWAWKSGDTCCLTRIISYTKAATKLVKAVKATEQQTYLKADGQNFAVSVSVSTPEVPYGGIFEVELLYKIMPGREQDSMEEETSHLIISWRVNFHKSSMMKSMIEGGVRQGLKESFETFANLLGENFKMMDPVELLEKDQVLASLENEHQSDLQLGFKYFWNFTMITTILIVLYAAVHVLMCKRGSNRGLEFNGLDLPDSFGEIFTCGFLTIQLQRVYYMILHFVQARLQKGSDHGVKAQGEGWILTVALIEGTNLASVDSTEASDPYVVFTCNGRTRTSSVKLLSSNPQWNEVIEFDAMEDPPSVLDVEIFDFDGPFDQSTSLGHAEINFLQHSSADLADMWIFLEGKLARSAQSKLHLRIFLDNTNGVETIKEYLTKMEKEVGKKLNLRSPHRNSAFQKLFGLPPEEFLISDFTCSLKRKLPLQGRLFLSARIVGFYANLFGHKTRFFFLWEDIEDIQILPPSLSSVGSPSLMIVLHKGRGSDARHAAKCQDEEGRLKFYFQSFVSFNVAGRTIMALWRTRILAPDQKVEVAEEQLGQENSTLLDDSGFVLDSEDVKTAKIYSAEIAVSISSLMDLFSGGKLEHEVMERSGCLGYTPTSWECTKPDIFERSLSYKFSRHVSMFGGEVTSTQQRSPSDEGWTVSEVMGLHNVPFSDHFRVILRYRILKSNIGSESICKCEVEMGMMWLKSSTFQDRISSNITEKFSHRVREMFELVEQEILLCRRRNSNHGATAT